MHPAPEMYNFAAVCTQFDCAPGECTLVLISKYSYILYSLGLCTWCVYICQAWSQFFSLGIFDKKIKCLSLIVLVF